MYIFVICYIFTSLPDLLGVSPPEEGAAGVAAVAPEVEMVGGGGGAHGAVQHQQRGGASLLNLNTLTSIYLCLHSQ